MPIQTSCPSCNQQVRVPDQLLGRNVKCPACSHVFLATDASGGGVPPTRPERVPPPPPSHEEQAPGEEFDDSQQDDYGDERPKRRRRRRRSSRSEEAGSRLTAPAICLLITGILWLLVAIIRVAIVMGGGGIEAAFNENPGMDEGIMKDPATKDLILTAAGLTLVLEPLTGVVVIAGAGCMLGRKLRGLAIASSIVAMLPCSACCLFGLPIGIWSLIVLMNPDVKDSFS